ncbi:peptidoglycan DD-metalloendopeptidase family protein [Georgenia muralis]|uniref:peptidoglycan DD-metalloendopeptidase family protein n=1 Tax=Georgenia muralis TaxID=154117 RepID=UPI000F4ECA88|nr:peptidoglycan DD-metalloendopeptidase family protein [Georgenia muralis]
MRSRRDLRVATAGGQARPAEVGAAAVPVADVRATPAPAAAPDGAHVRPRSRRELRTRAEQVAPAGAAAPEQVAQATAPALAEQVAPAPAPTAVPVEAVVSVTRPSVSAAVPVTAPAPSAPRGSRPAPQPSPVRLAPGTVAGPAPSPAPSSPADDTATWTIALPGLLPATRESAPMLSRPPARRQRRPPAPAAGRRPVAGWVPRAAVLSALGVLTIAAPMAGFATPADSTRAEIPVTASAMARLDAAAVALAGPAPAALLADPAAASRAEVLQTSRAADRDALRCAPVTGASGTRAAVAEERAELVMPMATGTYRFTSRYGNRSDPLSGIFGMHTGSDFAGSIGTPIYAVADGTVEYVGAGKDGRSGTLVVIRHELDGATFYSWYGHMYASGVLVDVGEEVEVGQHIAGVGNNGRSTGPHLHLEIHTDDQLTTVDPVAWLAEHGAQEPSPTC